MTNTNSTINADVEVLSQEPVEETESTYTTISVGKAVAGIAGIATAVTVGANVLIHVGKKVFNWVKGKYEARKAKKAESAEEANKTEE